MDKFDILGKYFGYTSFMEGQESLIDSILDGRDVLGVMPAGAGKSLCYQVPALLMSGITLVVSPLTSLMKDRVQALNQTGIHAAYIDSSLSESQIDQASHLAADGQYKIIYVEPELLETYDFMNFVRQADISVITVDEAHCISQLGQDFRPDYLKIVQLINKLDKRPIIAAFTEAATENVKEDIVCVLGLKNPDILVIGFDRKNLYFAVETPKKKDTYVIDYINRHSAESGIIYCATRRNVDNLYEKLSEQGISATKYHAGLTDEERRLNQEDFIYDRSVVMIATNAFGMGIDKSDVRYVIHYNMPQSLENYYQEAGLAGRDGGRSECILLYSAQDVVINRFLLDNKEQNGGYAQDEINAIRERDEERLKAMTHYCMLTGCLREYILNYFGEKGEPCCGRCLNCNNNLLRQANDKYPLLKPADKADEIIKTDALNSRGLELFEKFRDLRKTIAKEEGLPPYIIFSDKTLIDMCVRLPFDKKEMLKVTGVGESKFEKYGERFLNLISEYTGGVREKF